ncbi:hypothetical protein HB779_13970 [Phyllobacterium sp. 628]|uniref:hypothetical protein n=1 Tax=Phyllobacterium sp. 628 TaxID=2718938 RepID=UPI001662220C|nr:hypothetical protein [Phyllobacterium sp. 628]QND52890.1 hypothetical protein HB779_13970 [Phyllobacterium sp. 628]
MSISIEQARRAKPKAKEIAGSCAAVVGVGLIRIGDSYAIKINLRDQTPASADLPDTVDGVRVVYEVIGPISLHAVGDR